MEHIISASNGDVIQGFKPIFNERDEKIGAKIMEKRNKSEFHEEL